MFIKKVKFYYLNVDMRYSLQLGFNFALKNSKLREIFKRIVVHIRLQQIIVIVIAGFKLFLLLQPIHHKALRHI